MRLSPSTYASAIAIRRNDQSFFVSKVKVDGTETGRSSRINIPSGSGHSLEFVLSPNGAKVSGIVTDDKGRAVSGLPVIALPRIINEGSLTLGAVFATTDQNGRFQMVGLAPDTYYVAALNRINEIRGLQDVWRQSQGRPLAAPK